MAINKFSKNLNEHDTIINKMIDRKTGLTFLYSNGSSSEFLTIQKLTFKKKSLSDRGLPYWWEEELLKKKHPIGIKK